MTSNELRELVKAHFSLVEAPEATEEIVETQEEMSAEATEEIAVEETIEESFGELKDENGAFTLVFEGEELEVGKAVKVRTTEGQELDAPDGFHKLEGGITIKTEGGKVVEIMETEEPAEEAMAETEVEADEEMEVEVEIEEPSMESVVEAIAEAVKAEMEAMKAEMEALKAKVEKMEEAPATEKSTPANFSSKNLLEGSNVNPFNQDRFEAVMARFAKK
mgnify:CR=1 FL=1